MPRKQKVVMSVIYMKWRPDPADCRIGPGLVPSPILSYIVDPAKRNGKTAPPRSEVTIGEVGIVSNNPINNVMEAEPVLWYNAGRNTHGFRHVSEQL